MGDRPRLDLQRPNPPITHLCPLLQKEAGTPRALEGPYLPRKSRLQLRRREHVEGQEIMAHRLPPRTRTQATHHQDTAMLARE